MMGTIKPINEFGIPLKSCPFCGGAGDFRNECTGLVELLTVKVKCLSCDTVSPGGLTLNTADIRNHESYFKALGVAARNWNERGGSND